MRKIFRSIRYKLLIKSNHQDRNNETTVHGDFILSSNLFCCVIIYVCTISEFMTYQVIIKNINKSDSRSTKNNFVGKQVVGIETTEPSCPT